MESKNEGQRQARLQWLATLRVGDKVATAQEKRGRMPTRYQTLRVIRITPRRSFVTVPAGTNVSSTTECRWNPNGECQGFFIEPITEGVREANRRYGLISKVVRDLGANADKICSLSPQCLETVVAALVVEEINKYDQEANKYDQDPR